MCKINISINSISYMELIHIYKFKSIIYINFLH